MRKKLLIKVAIMIIILSLNLSLFTFVFAESYDKYKTSTITLQNIAITQDYNNISLGVFGKLTCVGNTYVLDGYIAGITMELQEYKNQEWTTIKTWSGTDADYIGLSTSYFVVKGTYRLKLTHIAYNSSMKQVESFVKYSKTIFYE
jgi:hypothetical protein